MKLPFFRGHARWREMADAYADGELGARGAARFESHSASCEACQALLADARSLKSMLVALPEIEVPRSFRLTPGMIAAPVEAPARPRPAYVTRAAQLTAGFAAAALAVVVIVDVAPSGNDDGTTSTAAGAQEFAAPATDDLQQELTTEDATPAEHFRSSNEQPAATGTAVADSTSTTADPPQTGAGPPSPEDGGVGAAGVGPGEPTPVPSLQYDSTTPDPDVLGREAEDSEKQQAQGGTDDIDLSGLLDDDADSNAPAITLQQPGGDDSSISLRVAEGALGGVLALAAAVWAGTWFARRRRV